MILDDNKNILGIIIPTYNNIELVKEAVLSVLCQPVKSLFVVVVDDGSTDGTIESLSELEKQDNRLILIWQENQGVSVARNRGISECIKLGVQYISFLDSDDVWCDDVYNQELFNILSKNTYDLIGFAYFNGNYQLTRGRYREPNKEKFKYTASFCSYIYSIKIFESTLLSFPEGIKANEDVVFYFLYSFRSESYCYFDKALFIHRSNKNSVSHKKHNLDNLYFEHSIPAWNWAEKHLDVNSGEYRECETMKKTMIPEYIIEACKQGYSVNRIKATINNSEFQYFNKEDDVWIDDASQKEFISFKTHPYRFWIKARIQGVLLHVGKRIKGIPAIENNRYPILLDVFYKKSNKE